jgi:hypothetical protein
MSESPLKAWRRAERPPRWIGRAIAAIVLVIGWPLAKLAPRWWSRFASGLLTRYTAMFPSGYRPTGRDVFVCSYFKSGTNWTMQMAVEIAHRGDARYEHIHDVVAWPDIAPRAGYAIPLDDESPALGAPTGLRVIKTHLKLEPVPYSPEARYICVVRDPKDVFVSSYHFTRAMMLGPLMPPVEAWLDVYLSPLAPIGSWAEHVASYWSVRERPNVLFMTYDDMKKDPSGAVDRVAALMGVELTSGERAAVIERSSFAHMKSIGHRFDAPGAPWASSAGAMMRKGESGVSHELLDTSQQRRIDAYWRAELERLACDFPYDRAFGRAEAPAA